MAFLIGGANSAADTGYDIENSCRFDESSDSSLGITFGTPTEGKAFTLSMWFKMCEMPNSRAVFGGRSGYENIFLQDNSMRWDWNNASSGTINWAPKLRDHSAWYHFVLAQDTAQSTDTNRAKFYINGTQITTLRGGTTQTWPAQNLETGYNQDGVAFYLSSYNGTAGNVTAYYSEVAFIDGLQYAASVFGETNDDGIWIPKEFKDDVTFGNNGFYLEFKQSGTGTDASGLGADTSGEDNHLVVGGLAAVDQCTDTPTNNFCVLNAINPTEANASFTEGNLKFTNTLNSSPHHGLAHGTMAVAKGKWYWEVRVDAIGGTAMGIGAEEVSAFGKNNVAGNQGISLFNHGYTHQRGSDVAVSGGTTYTTNDIIGVALDMDNRKIYFHKDGTYFNSGDPTSGATGTGAISLNAADVTMTPAVSNYNTGIQNCNFGNPQWTVSSTQADDAGYGNFEYDVPAGYYALCTKNLAEYG